MDAMVLDLGPQPTDRYDLARLEAGVAFPRLLRRFPRMAPAGEPVRRDTLPLRGFDALPVTVR